MGQYVPFDPAELRFLNNFLAHFPVGNDPYPNSSPDGFSRTNFHRMGAWNKTYINALIDAGLSETSLRGYYSERSDKRLNQTQKQFYAEVDRTTQELGIDMILVQKTMNIYVHDSRREGCRDSHELSRILDEFLAPIYVALRNKGYNKNDLWS